MKRSEPARAVVQFAVTGTCALLLLGFLSVTLLRNTGKSEAIRDARQTTRLAGEGVVAPAITPALERGDPRAIAASARAADPAGCAADRRSRSDRTRERDPRPARQGATKQADSARS